MTIHLRHLGNHMRRSCLWALLLAIAFAHSAYSAESKPAPVEKDSKPAAEQKESKPAPAKEDSNSAPAKKESKPAPVEKESKPEPAKKESKPAPPKEEPKPAPEKKEPKPAPPKEEPKPAPAKKESKPAPAKEESKPAPAKKESKPAPAKEGSKPAPAKDESKPAPAKEEAKPATAKKPSKPAPAVVEKVDYNLALQGEFVGTVALRPSKFRQIALQVRAAGGDGFEAAQFMGGLPSRPGVQPAAIQLIGKLGDGFLVLSGGPWAVLVHPNHCLLVDREGNKVGRLERVHRQSPTLGARPPKSAVVLFDGTGTEQFTNARMTEDGLLMEGADFKPMFQDFNLHLEFRLPLMPEARGQSRANSGVYLQSRYELQVLDSFAIPKLKDGCGGLYKFREPDVNMCFPPMVWQTYDIMFTAPRWASDGTKLANAKIRVWHNGVKIHNDVELPNKTGAGQLEEPTLLPIRLQNHGNPVRYRNVWLIDRGASPPTRFPVQGEAAGDK